MNNLNYFRMETSKPHAAPFKKWDTIYSTFYWNIHLDIKHPMNSTPVLTGYSKKEGDRENKDPDAMLKRKILNLLINGYFKRMERIDIFMRTEFAIDKKRDPKILVLYPTHYDIPELNHDVIFKKFGVFLKEFYDRLNASKSMDGLLPKMKSQMQHEDYLKPENFKFPTVAHLYQHAARCITNGHASGEVNHFVLRVKAMNNW